jgi:hypothetical protein
MPLDSDDLDVVGDLIDCVPWNRRHPWLTFLGIVAVIGLAVLLAWI